MRLIANDPAFSECDLVPAGLVPARLFECLVEEKHEVIQEIDAGKIADCLRCDFLPACHMASTAIRDRRRVLRYRSLVIKQSVQMKNRCPVC